MNNDHRHLALCCLVALAIRALLVVITPSIQPVDMAAYGLMAQAIRDGRDVPLLLWGNHYGGTLTSYVCVPLFMCFGMSMRTLGLATVPWVIPHVLAAYGVAARLVSRRAALMLAWLVSCAPAGFAMSSMLASYAEGLALSWCAVWMALRAADTDDEAQARRWWWRCGVVNGLALWEQPIAIPGTLAICAILRGAPPAGRRPAFSPWCLGTCVGMAPVLLHNLRYPGATFLRVAGRIFGIDRATFTHAAAPLTLLGAHAARTLRQSFDGVGHLAISLRTLLSGGALPLAGQRCWATGVLLGGLLATCWLLCRKRLTAPGRPLVISLWVWTIAIYLVNRTYVSRYLLPLYPLLALAIAAWIAQGWSRPRWPRAASCAVFAGLLIWNLATLASLRQRRPIAFQPVITYLLTQHIRTAYATPDLSYPLMVDAQSRIVVSPTLLYPYPADRLPQQTALVQATPEATYLAPTTSATDAALAAALQQLHVSYERVTFGEVAVYAHVSRHVTPAELQLPQPPEDDTL